MLWQYLCVYVNMECEYKDEVSVSSMNTKSPTGYLQAMAEFSPQEVTSTLASLLMNKYIITFPSYICC